MDKNNFVSRLIELRMNKGVSAREMSLSLGQSPSYINNIENGKNLPSMAVFFDICDYLNVTPKEFFETENSNPQKTYEVVEIVKNFKAERMEHLIALLKEMK